MELMEGEKEGKIWKANIDYDERKRMKSWN
jgi:hypothetical protein